MYKKYLKAYLDKTISLGIILLSLPVTLPVMALLSVFNRGQVFFLQQRPGLYGRPFYIWKFKTMSDRKDAKGHLLPDKDRLTAIGKLLRKTSIDELPQLWNVLKGDISLIGPRPLLMEYLPLYSAEQARRHEVKPGISGWAQVNGRNAISWEEKFRLDVYYVDHCSFALDMRIFWMTIYNIFRAKDINSPMAATMRRFQGTSSTTIS